MRYQILKFMSKHPLAMSVTLLYILGTAIVVFPIIPKEVGWIIIFIATCIGFYILIEWMANGFEEKKCFELFKRIMNFDKYEKRYCKNEKILKEIYLYKLENLAEDETLLNFRPIQNMHEHFNLEDLKKWYIYLTKHPLELRKTCNKEILQKLYQATENTMKLYESAEYDSKNNLEKNIKIVFTDINHLCNQAKKAIDTDGEIQSIFEAKEINCDEKKNVKYLIYQVNSILENEVEFEETVKKLKRIQDLIPEEELSAKFKIVLENMVICSEKFENSNDSIYEEEFKELIIKLNQYLDKILKGEEEAVAMQDVATVRALKDFIS